MSGGRVRVPVAAGLIEGSKNDSLGRGPVEPFSPNKEKIFWEHGIHL